MAGRCNASQDAQDTWDAGDASLASGRNADRSDAGSVFANVAHGVRQRTGVDFIETYSATISFLAIRILLCKAAAEDNEII